jgi:putative transcription factor
MQHEQKGQTGIKSMQDWEQLYLTKTNSENKTKIKQSSKSSHSTQSNQSTDSTQKEKDEFNLKKPSLDFQKTLQQARLSLKMTQKDLALKAGIQLNILQGYENGKEIPSNLIISKLEKLLNTKLPRIYKKE